MRRDAEIIIGAPDDHAGFAFASGGLSSFGIAVGFQTALDGDGIAHITQFRHQRLADPPGEIALAGRVGAVEIGDQHQKSLGRTQPGISRDPTPDQSNQKDDSQEESRPLAPAWLGGAHCHAAHQDRATHQ